MQSSPIYYFLRHTRGLFESVSLGRKLKDNGCIRNLLFSFRMFGFIHMSQDFLGKLSSACFPIFSVNFKATTLMLICISIILTTKSLTARKDIDTNDLIHEV